MKYKNICLTITNFANKGGEERMCATLANALSANGYHVIIVSTDKPSSQKSCFDVSSLIKCYSLKSNRVERKLSRIPVFNTLWLLKYKMILKRHNIQVVIDVDVHNSLITTKVVSKDKVRIVSWDHFNYERFLSWPTRELLHDCFINKIDKLVVLTKSDKHDYIEKEGIPSSRVTQIYNPSPIETNTLLEHSQNKILAIGRFAEQKGFDLLIETWSYVEKKYQDWFLEIVGEGAGKKELEDKINSLGLKNVIISPFVKNVRQKYADASIYVLSSRYEGLCLVLLEAISMSLPIVSFNCPKGPEEIIEDGVNGYLVPPLNTKMLADKLMLLMGDVEKRKEMGKNGYLLSKKFKIENITAQWINLLESI